MIARRYLRLQVSPFFCAFFRPGFQTLFQEESDMKTKSNTTRKLALAGILTAVAVVGSLISVPVAGSKCAPVQHMVNVFAAVVL